MNEQVKRLSDEARKLSPEDRAELIEQIWDTLADDEAAIPIPDWHKTELDRRLAEHESDPAVVPGDVALARLRDRRRP